MRLSICMILLGLDEFIPRRTSLALVSISWCSTRGALRALGKCQKSSATLSDLARPNHPLSTLIVDRADLVNNASVGKKEGGSKNRALKVMSSPDVMGDRVVIKDVPPTRCS
jgi:hypothetical protein